MTTFANPFTQPSNMQAPEDAMEVNSEMKAMVDMEEDNIDIDFELGDGPQHDHDEDSMMDDGDGQNQADGDQQMDDFQENKDQDDEVLDYTEDTAPVMEVPMTEDMAQPAVMNTAPQLANLFSGPFPQTSQPDATTAALFPSTHISPVQPLPNALGVASQDQDAGDANNILKSDRDSIDHLESIRNLYETPVEPTVPPQNEAVITNTLLENNKTITQDDVESTDQNTNQAASQVTQPEINTAQGQMADEASVTTRAPDAAAVNQLPPKEGRLELHEPTAEAVAPDALTNDDKTRNSSPEANAEPTETHAEPTEPQVESEESPSDLVEILVTCQGQQMSLFPPYREHGTPETYLLPDDKLAGSPIRSLLSTCSEILSDSMGENEELELHMPSLKLCFTEHAAEAEHYSIRDMSYLHFQLHQNDGVEQPESLHIILEVSSKLGGHIDRLYALASEGKGMRYLQESRTDSGANEEVQQQQGDARTDQYAGGDSAQDFSVENQRDNNEEEEEEFGEPDLPQDLQQIPGLDNNEDDGHELAALKDEDLQAAGDVDHISSTQSERDVLASNNEAGVAAIATETENEISEAEELADDSRITEHENSHSGAQHAKDDEHAEGAEENHADQPYHTGDTNDDNAEVDDIQQHALDPAVDEHQSLLGKSQLPDDTSHAEVLETEEVLSKSAEQIKDGTVSTDQPEPRDNEASLATIQDPSATAQDGANDSQSQGDDDFFNEDDFGNADQPEIEEPDGSTLDFGAEERPPNTPQALKRSRTAAEEVGEDAEDDDGHQLKRTRSG